MMEQSLLYIGHGNTIAQSVGGPNIGVIFLVGMLIFGITFFVAACYLEVRLSKAEEWWKGLIPMAVLLVFGALSSPLGIVLLVIYGVNRYKIKKKNDEIKQMKIKDL